MKPAWADDWTGGKSSDWFVPGNWQDGTVPGAGDGVVIDTDTPNGNGAVVDGGRKATVGRVQVGNTSTGVLTISKRGTVESVIDPDSDDLNEIGHDPGSRGTVTVTGPGSLWSMNAGLDVLSGTLAIENGGRVTVTGTTTAAVTLDSGSILKVTGSGSSFVSNDVLDVGFSNGEGTLTIAAGGVVTSASGVVGDSPNITGMVTVTGPGSRWSMSDGLSGGGDPPPGALIIGSAGTGTVTVAEGGVVSASGPVTIGQEASASGTLNIGAAAGEAAAPAGELQAATVAFGAGAGFINFNHTDDNYTFAPRLSGNGMLTAFAGTTILPANSAAFTGTTNVIGGTLQVDGTLGGTVVVDAEATLAGTGTVRSTTVGEFGRIAPGKSAGNSIGTLTTSDITFEDGSTYAVELAGTNSDLIHATGPATLNGGSVVVNANGNIDPSATYTILTADGGVDGKFDGVTSNFAFLNPMLQHDAANVLLTLERNNALLHHVTHTTNQRNVAHALEKLPDDHPLLQAVLIQTVAGARTAFDALHGEVHASIGGVLVDESRYVRDAVLGRLRQASYTNGSGAFAALAGGGPQTASLGSARGASAPEAMALGYAGGAEAPPSPWWGSGLTVWSQGFGAWGDFDGNRNAAAAERNLGGFVSGLDAILSPGWRAGLAAGASFSDIEVDRRLSSAEVDSTHLAAYLGGTVGAFALRAGGAWSWSEIDTSRAIAFPSFFERARAAYDADTGQVFGELAYPMAMGRFALEPYAGLAYVHFGADSFRERGQTAALEGRSQEADVGYATLGLRVASTAQWGGHTVTPHASAAWQHAFEDTTPQSRLAFAATGIGFAVAGVPLAEDSALLEAGLDIALGPNMTAGVSYTGQLSDDVTDNAVEGRFSWRF